MLKERTWNFALGMAFSTVIGVVSPELLDCKLLEEDTVALELEDIVVPELLEERELLESRELLEEDAAMLELLALLEDDDTEGLDVGRMSSGCFA